MDTVQLDVPLFIRLLELSREEIKNDADIHDLAQIIIEKSKTKTLTMADYDELVGFMKKQGNSSENENLAHDDIRRFRQIVDLADTGEVTDYSNTPKEQYSTVDSVTTLAGGGVHSPKHPNDLRGNSFSIYK